MAEVLLSSEKFIKDTSSISDNTAARFILPALREAQEIGLRSILGDAMLDKLKALVASGEISIPANEAYNKLAARCKYYLTYATLVEVAEKTSYKIGNMGVVKTSDENVQPASAEEVDRTQAYYQGKADFYCDALQRYALDHCRELPELSENTLHRIKANLTSAATCGVFLGGARGKIIR